MADGKRAARKSGKATAGRYWVLERGGGGWSGGRGEGVDGGGDGWRDAGDAGDSGDAWDAGSLWRWGTWRKDGVGGGGFFVGFESGFGGFEIFIGIRDEVTLSGRVHSGVGGTGFATGEGDGCEGEEEKSGAKERVHWGDLE